MNRKTWLSLLGAASIAVFAGFYTVKQAVTASVSEYFYAYPIVLMEQTYDVMTTDMKLMDSALENRFVHTKQFPDPSFTVVVKPNNDTLYSSGWYDVSEEPVVLSVPDMGDRYFMFPIMDMWTEIFTSIGSRTTGQEQSDFLLVAKGWQGYVPEGLTVIEAPTTKGWIIGRTLAEGEKDYPEVSALQEQYLLRKLSDWQTGSEAMSGITRVACEVCSTPPPVTVANMDAATFYDRFAELLAQYPGHAEDAAILDDMSANGLTQVGGFDRLPFYKKWLVELGVTAAKKILQDPPLPNPVEGWSVSIDDIGSYNQNYAKRAVIAKIGLGANEAIDATYPMTAVDVNNELFDGSKSYILHFDADEIPPVNGFWSLTMYNDDGYFIENTIDRYSIGSRNNLIFNQDGSLDILIQHKAPADNSANWLPAPAEGFNVAMRLYWPKDSVLNGDWYPPAITPQ